MNGVISAISHYCLPEMEKVWSDQNRFQQMLQVELCVCEAMKDMGRLDKVSYDEIVEKAGFDLQRIKELENVTKHDVAAFLQAVTERVGEEKARNLHWGMAASDVLDTAMAVQMRQAVDLLLGKLYHMRDLLSDLARKHKYTLMVGRSHGIHAEPMSFGLKMVVWLNEIERTVRRMQAARYAVAVGKVSGAVGAYAHVDPFVEEHVCRRLDLRPATAASQILQRDRHAELLLTLALLGSTLDKFATDIRTLERTEIGEVYEPLEEGAVASSALPHKVNPVKAESISGLARVLRGNAMAALENVPLWDERDMTHSSAENIIIRDSCLLADYMIQMMLDTLSNIEVNREQMENNLDMTRGLIFSQRVLMALMEHGALREQAYEIVQRNAAAAHRDKTDFAYYLLQDPEFMSYISIDELDSLFDYEYYMKNLDYIYRRVGIF